MCTLCKYSVLLFSVFLSNTKTSTALRCFLFLYFLHTLALHTAQEAWPEHGRRFRRMIYCATGARRERHCTPCLVLSCLFLTLRTYSYLLFDERTEPPYELITMSVSRCFLTSLKSLLFSCSLSDFSLAGCFFFLFWAFSPSISGLGSPG
ncbi:hypothetical protein NEFER03_1952 [Nematocida sp. LUAm3]|nr:hypothetical protein NEFER03_1952 [Nematocida sp. LUAm3]KAI5176452.1 hypothetical protein NEFER02_2207 [Nematocida sp. LUAm2]KAI5179328.1 hypothetical protein NEFER01_2172 [Nematocida sp. LUAm1]